MSLEFRLEAFEGPLDLLLLLIEKNKVDIYDIPIAEIADQYMAYVEEMESEDLDVLSDFLLMASTLLDIKARMLLPKEKDEDGEEIDPRTELVERLLEYQEFRLRAAELRERYQNAEDSFFRDTVLPEDVLLYKPPTDYEELLKDVTPERLRSIFEMVAKRREDSIDPERSRFGNIRKDPVRLSEKLSHVMTLGKERKHFSFRELLEEDRTRQGVVVTFLACLELIRIGQISVSKKKAADDIFLDWNEDCDTSLTLEDMKQYD